MSDILDTDDLSMDVDVISGAVAPSTIWQELDTWGKALPDWQRFIVSYAVRDGKLGIERFLEANRLFLREVELDDGAEELPIIPETITGRSDEGGTRPIILKELKTLKGVNAIPEASALPFGAGLTVVYGRNGAGKSGFARILSDACFSRSETTIIGNVFDLDAPGVPATAQIVVDLGDGGDETIEHTVGDENAALQRISVFDASAARIHLAQENPLGFQPIGFDVFDEVGRIIGLVGKKLASEIEVRTNENNFGKLFIEPGSVADEISQLSAKTDIAALRVRGTFGATEQKRLEEVARQEQEASAKSSVETLKALAVAKSDIESIRERLDKLLPQISEDACTLALVMLAEQKAITRVALKAGAEAISHPNFTQIGTGTWDTFVKTSRILGQAENEAYPKEGEPCLPCHRPLDQPSTSLIRRMWSFLDHDARMAMQGMDNKVSAEVDGLRSLSMELLPEGSRIRSDLSKIDPDLVAALVEFSSNLSVRKDALSSALDIGDDEAFPTGDVEIPQQVLDDAVAKIEVQEEALKDGKFEEIIAKLKAEHIELRQRQVLNKNIEDVVSFVQDLKWTQKAAASKRALSPRFLTDKQKSLFQTHVEGAYREHLGVECGLLDCSLPFELKTRGSAG